MRQVIIDLIDTLKNCGFVAENAINGEGRVASLSDEKNIVEFLLKHDKWKNIIKRTKLRSAGDIIVLDYDENHPPHLINIKTTNLTRDNATSIVGFAYGLTNLTLDELPSRLSIKGLIGHIKKNPNNLKTKDYYYLVFDKTNMNNVTIRPLKDVEFWYPNPSNRLQIDWSKEFNNSNVTDNFKISAERIINGLRLSWEKQVNKMPKNYEWVLYNTTEKPTKLKPI